MGGGQDTQQIAIEADLHQHKAEYLRKLADEKALFLTICGGYQLLGHYYKPHEGKPLKGLSLIDAYTEAGNKRMIGNVLCQLPSGETLVGFENHSGRTFLGEGVTPLGKITVGHGNNGDDKHEGVWHENFVGTYLHGPLLPKNPALADALLLQALQRKYGVEEIGQTLPLLDDYWEQHAHQQAKLLVSTAN
jgi:CobQ-like glutamine amidotransferase family enzyme